MNHRAVMIYSIWWSLFISPVFSQDTLSLTVAYDLTEQNIPLLRSIDLYAEIEAVESKLLAHNRKPIIALKGNAGLQSEALQIGSAAPNSPINIDLPLYNARAYGEINYNIYEGGVIQTRQEMAQLQRIVQQEKVAVDLYPFRQQVNRLFTSIDLARKVIQLFDLTLENIAIRQVPIAAGIEMGVVLESEQTQLVVRQLEIENEKRSVQSSITSALATLSVLTGQRLSSDTILEFPELENKPSVLTIDRPELSYFQSQTEAIQSRKKLIDVLDKPEIFVFAQTGIAYPNALNFSNVQVAPFAIAGITFNYKLFDKKDKEYQRQKIDLERQLIAIQEEQFKKQVAIEGARYHEEIQALRDQLINLERITQLQAELLIQLGIQLDNGIITASDYLIQSNTELKARQNLEITKSRLYQKQLEYITIYGTNHLE